MLDDLSLIDAYRAAGAREDLLDFAQLMAPSEWPADHHRVIAKFFMALWRGDFDKLMIFVPPRHAKSTYSRYFMAWALGLRPKTKIVHVTHTGGLADEVGYETRKLLDSEFYPWPIKSAADRSARRDWTTTAGGKYFGTSMQGGPTGRPANILIVDDPLTNAEDADSQIIRDKQWQEYERGLRSRLEPWADGKPPIEILIMTRWSEDDLAGRHLPLDYAGQPGVFESRMFAGEKWVVCSLPARAEHENDLLRRQKGEWLWPERFGDGSAHHKAELRGGRTWSSLYQQRPAPEDGVLLKAEWFRWYDKAPALDTLTIYGASDYAVTEAGRDSSDPDYTVHMVFGVDPDWNVYVLDLWRQRKTSDVWVGALIDLARDWKPLIWGEESGQILSSMDPIIRRKMMDERVFFARRQMTSKQKKTARAGEFAAQNGQTLIGWMAQGKWYLPRSIEALPAKSWWRKAGHQFASVDDLKNEMLKFPAGRHDDMVDAQSLFARLLGEIISGQEPKPEEKIPPGSLESLFREHEATL
jgi:hypothetical protein